MKKYLVVGNPIQHSLSPKLQNYWLKLNNIEAIYGKLQAYDDDLKELCNNIKNGKLDGMAMRVPVPDGSVVDLVVELEKSVSIDDVNKAVKQAADNELKGILEYSEVPLVSTDILNNPHSSIYDASSTQLLEGNHVKVVCWYDNEWGYSNRVVDLIGNLLNNG